MHNHTFDCSRLREGSYATLSSNRPATYKYMSTRQKLFATLTQNASASLRPCSLPYAPLQMSRAMCSLWVPTLSPLLSVDPPRTTRTIPLSREIRYPYTYSLNRSYTNLLTQLPAAHILFVSLTLSLSLLNIAYPTSLPVSITARVAQSLHDPLLRNSTLSSTSTTLLLHYPYLTTSYLLKLHSTATHCDTYLTIPHTSTHPAHK